MKSSELSSIENVLSRSEMKNIMAGNSEPHDSIQSSCDYEGCSGSSAVFNCWYAECTHFYSGQDAIDCVNDVGASHQLTIAMCGPNYS